MPVLAVTLDVTAGVIVFLKGFLIFVSCRSRPAGGLLLGISPGIVLAGGETLGLILILILVLKVALILWRLRAALCGCLRIHVGMPGW